MVLIWARKKKNFLNVVVTKALSAVLHQVFELAKVEFDFLRVFWEKLWFVKKGGSRISHLSWKLWGEMGFWGEVMGGELASKCIL